MTGISLTTDATRPSPSRLRRVAPFVPYLAVVGGMFGLRNAWAAVFGYHLGMALVLALDRRCGDARQLGTGMQWLNFSATALFGISGGVILYLCWPFLGLPPGFNEQLAKLGISAATWPYFLAYFCLVNPWLEEVYWRGYLADASVKPVWNDLLFAGYHLLVLAPFVQWLWLLPMLGGLVLAGWLWRRQACHTGGLLIPLASHFLADTAIMLTVYLNTSGQV